MQRYHYDPLPLGRQLIRVLDLERDPKTGELACCISQVPVSAESGYQALSYEWGTPETLFHINIFANHGEDVAGGDKVLGIIPVTRNLCDALNDLLDADALPSNRFWIDQICINQSDLDERARQVALMSAVYRCASSVVTYLGPLAPDGEEENRAFHLLDRILKHFEPNRLVFAEEDPYDLRNRNIVDGVDMIPVRGLPDDIDEKDPSWLPMLRILFGGWTRRLWILQENVLCDVMVMLRGQRVLDWSEVLFVPLLFLQDCIPDALLLEHWDMLGFNTFQMTNHLYAQAMQIWRIRIEMQEDSIGADDVKTSESDLPASFFDFEENLGNSLLLGHSDPRDKIYALLGISRDAKRLGIVPSYTRSVRDVFVVMSRRVYLTSREPLYLLQTVGILIPGAHDRLDERWPSWAFRPGVTGEEPLPQSAQPHPLTIASIEFKDDDVMIVRGRVVDHVSYATPAVPFSLVSQPGAAFSRACQDLPNLALIFQHVGVSVATAADVVRALVADALWHEMEDTVEAAYYLWCFMSYSAAQLREQDERKRESHPPSSMSIARILLELEDLLRKEVSIASGIAGPQNSTEQDSTDNAFTDIDIRRRWGVVNGLIKTSGRSLCVSRDERICNTTGKVKAGDALAIFSGQEYAVAFVLRPLLGSKGDCYEYVGTAYVQGIMMGEAYQGLDPNDVDEDVRLV